MLRLSAVILAAALPACGATLDFMRPGSETLFSTRVCGVHIDGRTRTTHLRIELVPAGGLPRGAFVEVEFENPEAGGKPLVTGQVYKGDERTFVVLSPPVKDVRPRHYAIVAHAYAARDKSKLIGTYKHMCESLVDQRELP